MSSVSSIPIQSYPSICPPTLPPLLPMLQSPYESPLCPPFSCPAPAQWMHCSVLPSVTPGGTGVSTHLYPQQLGCQVRGWLRVGFCFSHILLFEIKLLLNYLTVNDCVSSDVNPGKGKARPSRADFREHTHTSPTATSGISLSLGSLKLVHSALGSGLHVYH